MLRLERMLLGSRNAALPRPAPPIWLPATPPPAVPAVEAPVLPAPAPTFLSSTGAVLSGVCVLAQPASRTAKRALMTNLFMLSPVSISNGCSKGRSSRKRSPGRFAHIAGGRSQSLLDSAVARDGGQYTTAPHLGCVEDHLAVRRDAGRFVEWPLGQQLHLSTREVLQRKVESVAIAAHEHEPLAIGEMSRRHVVATVVGHALDRAADRI